MRVQCVPLQRSVCVHFSVYPTIILAENYRHTDTKQLVRRLSVKLKTARRLCDDGLAFRESDELQKNIIRCYAEAFWASLRGLSQKTLEVEWYWSSCLSYCTRRKHVSRIDKSCRMRFYVQTGSVSLTPPFGVLLVCIILGVIKNCLNAWCVFCPKYPTTS